LLHGKNTQLRYRYRDGMLYSFPAGVRISSPKALNPAETRPRKSAQFYGESGRKTIEKNPLVLARVQIASATAAMQQENDAPFGVRQHDAALLLRDTSRGFCQTFYVSP
jgi:hypothetical protein